MYLTSERQDIETVERLRRRGRIEARLERRSCLEKIVVVVAGVRG